MKRINIFLKSGDEMNPKLFFYPVKAELIEKKYADNIPEKLNLTKHFIKSFFMNTLRNSHLAEQDMYYFICLSDHAMLLKISKDIILTGMIFESDMIICAWFNISGLVCYLADKDYEDIADKKEIYLNEINSADIEKKQLYNTIEKRFQNSFIPQSFIIDQNLKIESDVMNYLNTESRIPNQKKCIPYNKEKIYKASEAEKKSIIEYKQPDEGKKNIFKLIKEKKQKDTDFIKFIKLKIKSDEEYQIESLSKIFHMNESNESNLLRLDKILVQIKDENS